jgi:hypothetical protein
MSSATPLKACWKPKTNDRLPGAGREVKWARFAAA